MRKEKQTRKNVMSVYWMNSLLILVATLGMGACGGSSNSGGASNNAAGVANAEVPKKDDEKAKAASGATPKWVVGVAAKPVTAKVGDMVWAVVYKDDTSAGNYAPIFSTFKVEAISGNTATLSRESPRESFTNIPGALIHPLPDKSSIKVGDITTVNPSGMFPTIGRVTKVEAGKVTLKYVEGAFMDKTPVQEKIVEEVYPVAILSSTAGSRSKEGAISRHAPASASATRRPDDSAEALSMNLSTGVFNSLSSKRAMSATAIFPSQCFQTLAAVGFRQCALSRLRS